MKTKAFLFIAVGLVLFLLGGLVMNQVVTAQVKMQPSPMPTTRIVWDYDSGWVSISPDEWITLTHNLGHNPDEYVVYLIGRGEPSAGVDIHQGKYGTSVGYGCRWHKLNSTTIGVYRGCHDGEYPWEDERWVSFRLRILKNQ